ncbi:MULTISPECIES: bifunctional phosphoribosyl-AMP cyclohydrolase/phosphoribosyl-ATP diphosphatase HisIE [Dyadobacter]|uniref:Histidine biosynthesis bifunctional protein HisIE n=1 Tax=Dyadobacter chenhuakuii TaxID=2909339 RepID=A0A9X1QH22_9BACT|nr:MULTISPECIES: bifunctional phosphoribosyl-AMP cyclohydrolase/phosphoribosyl-ATP diphosphatase HisIE [Dyadobacter]MCF2495322.1 bifunctional phosphoribosyl-AMP cyclohydrolase/phosphoribosyl-ATP diphosphatase HisIE [Dyadobacter chenhuakuii]MCF2500367.1 bifunctional phosphoribosyl-AMP cyclohydrolase/phosphoribosyl-ATP diphosphatase HisIE [Dyadobacter chenhuakuii]MCF2516096.1 bifunctional phosphoribosyl-AMP cyclohydrolase/phosphoribosyl-ATP diphosphatase HisIE [Dyadobacter sp. CY351]USJ29362.1 bi
MSETFSTIDFNKSPDGLIPAIIQDINTNKVLMLGYMSQEALERTKELGTVTFFSRSKQRLWTKGETSGNFLFVNEIAADCDGDTILIKATPAGPTCHTGADTCFGEKNSQDTRIGEASFLNYLQKEVIRERKLNPLDESYTSSLFRKGINKIAQKVGEEAVEVVIESKDDDADLFKNEVSDLLFHLLVLLEQKNIDLDEVISVLRSRHQ